MKSATQTDGVLAPSCSRSQGAPVMSLSTVCSMPIALALPPGQLTFLKRHT